MVVRFTRSCVLLLVVALTIYLTSFTLRDEADLPQWARSVKDGSWSWELLTYDLEYLKQELHSALEHHPEKTQTWPQQSVGVGDSTRSVTTTSFLEPKPTLPPRHSGPSPYAYVFPITGDEVSCAALINIDRLIEEFNTRHRIIALIRGNMTLEYLNALNARNITILEEKQLHQQDGEHSGRMGALKLEAFRLRQVDATLKRVLVVDPDALILRSLDSVFDLPVVDLAAPRAYWRTINDMRMSSTTMLITLSDRVGERVEQHLKKIDSKASADSVINTLFGKIAILLPGSYDTQALDWDKWNLPDWFRPEEVTEMEEAGRFTGKHLSVKPGTPARIAALGFAVARWKSDFWDPEVDGAAEGDAAKNETSDSSTKNAGGNSQASRSDEGSNRSAGEVRKRDIDEAGAMKGKMELIAAQQAAILRDRIDNAADQADSLAHGAHQAGTQAVPFNEPLSGAPGMRDSQGSTVTTMPDPTEVGVSSQRLVDSSKESPQTGAIEAQSQAIDIALSEAPISSSEALSSETLPASTQYFSDMPVPSITESSFTTTSESEPTPTPIDKGALDRPLYNLHRVAHVLRFPDDQKPWQMSVEESKVGHEDAHGAWAEHYKQWREMAKRVCPAINRTSVEGGRSQWKMEKLVEQI